MAEVTLTHKLRNPKSYNEWMNIWTATVQDPETQGASPKYIITPSENWNISSNVLDKIPVNKIESFTDISANPQTTTHNVTITDPNGNEYPKGSHIAVTNNDGSISEGAAINPDNGNSNKFLDEKGNFTLLPNYTLSAVTKTIGQETSSTYLLFQRNNNSQSEVGIHGMSPLNVNTNLYGDISINIIDKSIAANKIADNTITPNEIDWDYEDPNDSTNTMANAIKDSIGLNSSTNNGTVLATGGVSNAGKIWTVGSDGEPDWNNVSANEWNQAEDESLTASKLDTKLLGAWISKDQPTSSFSNAWDWKHLGIWIEI